MQNYDFPEAETMVTRKVKNGGVWFLGMLLCGVAGGTAYYFGDFMGLGAVVLGQIGIGFLVHGSY